MMHRIDVDADVMAAIKARAVPFEDRTPNDVLRRVFQLDARTDKTNALPQKAYYAPIRDVMSLGKPVTLQDLRDGVLDRMKPQLGSADFGRLKTGAIRWQNRIGWCLKDMELNGEVKRVAKKTYALLKPRRRSA
jgi:hypothetical protein